MRTTLTVMGGETLTEALSVDGTAGDSSVRESFRKRPHREPVSTDGWFPVGIEPPRSRVIALHHSQDSSRQAFATHFREKAETKLGSPDLRVVGPWSESISPSERARALRFILAAAYGNVGHPALASPPKATEDDLTSERILTWLLYQQEHPVGTASLAIKNDGTAEMCRAAAVPVGHPLSGDKTYLGGANVSGVQYARLADFLESSLAQRIWALDSELRMSAKIESPDRSSTSVASGAITQGINAALTPFLMFDPRFTDTYAAQPFLEGFFLARLYLDPQGVAAKETLYTPAVNTNNPEAVSLAEIVRVTYAHAFTTPPTLEHAGKTSEASPRCTLLQKSEDRYGIYRLEGQWNAESLRDLLSRLLTETRIVQFVIPNDSGHVTLQADLYRLGLIPLGATPGGQFTIDGEVKSMPTTWHMSTLRRGLDIHIRDIEISRQYAQAGIADLSHRLLAMWRALL